MVLTQLEFLWFLTHPLKEIWNGEFSSGNVLGLASWKPSDKVWKLKTKIGKQFDSTVIHELGHALGLDHPESHDTTKNTVMSYSRDRAINRFYYKDLDVLNTIYIEEDYVLQDVVPKEVKIDMILGECFRNEHQKKKHGKHSSRPMGPPSAPKSSPGHLWLP